MHIGRMVAERDLAERLVQAQKLESLGQLTGGIAHDFNNILTVILSTARFLEDAIPPGSAHAADLADLQVAAQRGAEMIRKLLAFSRAGQLSFEPHALDHVLAESLQMLRRMLPASVGIEVDIDPATAVVRADPGAVDQMVLNLATNARDAMPNGGTIHLRLAPATMDADFVASRGWGVVGRYALLSVRDTGTGMEPDVLARLFEPFFTTKPPGQGSGLGMAMVYGLMKQHGGFVEVTSAPREGTTVTLFFPAVEASPASPVASTRAARGVGGNVLLVEDEPELRRVAQRLLEGQGYRVLVAADGEEGLAMAKAHLGELDLVLSDVVMPRMSGPALYAALARERIDLPFLFTSGYTAREMPDGAPMPAGVALLLKPWNAEELAAKVRESIDRARR
jgi:nitrogen-specific signal transduction histidine kinase/ActR/RegA family two-component response regulator